MSEKTLADLRMERRGIYSLLPKIKVKNPFANLGNLADRMDKKQELEAFQLQEKLFKEKV